MRCATPSTREMPDAMRHKPCTTWRLQLPLGSKMPMRSRTPLILVLWVASLLTGCLERGDALAPIVAISEPKSGTTRTTDALRIEGYAMDDEGVARIEAAGTDLLEADVYAGEKGKRFIAFAFTIPNLQEGETTTRIVVHDVSGRTSTLLYTLQIDVTPPSLELLDVQDLGDGRVRLEGIARDDVAVNVIRIDDIPLQFVPAPEHRFAFDRVVSDDARVVVEDSAGNVVERSLR